MYPEPTLEDFTEFELLSAALRLRDLAQARVPGGRREGGQFSKTGSGAIISIGRGGLITSDGRADTENMGYKATEKMMLTKHETGRLGEEIATRWLKDQGLLDAKALNTKGSSGIGANDLFAGGDVWESKAGLAQATKGARQWRITTSTSVAEKEAKKLMTKAQWKEYNAGKIDDAVARKKKSQRTVQETMGVTVKQRTVTMIVNPKTRTADIFTFTGVHKQIGWNSSEAKKAYRGSVRY